MVLNGQVRGGKKAEEGERENRAHEGVKSFDD